jgi:gas vesicle protein
MGATLALAQDAELVKWIILSRRTKTMAEKNGSGGDSLVYFLIGAGIGAITALLFAPKAGNELRSEIADATRKGLEYTRDTGQEIAERASDLTARGKEAVSDLTDLGKDLINRQKAQIVAAYEGGKQGHHEDKQSDHGKVSSSVAATID